MKNFSLQNDEVHVWSMSLDVLECQIEDFWQIISQNEQQRAERFRFDRHRRRYIVTHGMLRIFLSRYIDVEPAQVTFSYSPKGKPELACDKEIRFNLSNSHERAIYAVARNLAVGIDIEHIRPLRDAMQIAERYFFQSEIDTLYAISNPDHRLNAFFDIWTIKEAYLKATGEGIAGLERIEVSISHEKPAIINGCGIWSVHRLIPCAGYTAAVVVNGSVSLRCFPAFL